MPDSINRKLNKEGHREGEDMKVLHAEIIVDCHQQCICAWNCHAVPWPVVIVD